MALEKAQDGWNRVQQQKLADVPVLAADTTVVLDDKILGKPMDSCQAYDMLRSLGGRRHQVLSAVSVADGDRTEMALSVSDVEMASLSD